MRSWLVILGSRQPLTVVIPAQSRNLCARGPVVLQGYTPKQLDYRTGGPPILSHLFIEALLREQFAELDIEVLQGYEADAQEGTSHSGRSALIGMVARKR